MNKFSYVYLRMFLKIKVKQMLNFIPFFKQTDYTLFLILCHPRTGSSLLHTYLNSHGSILSLNEPLTKSVDSELVFKAYSKKIAAVGLKYFYEYVDDPNKKKTFFELLKNDNLKIIQLERKNQLRTFLSLRIAEKTNEWSSTGKLKRSAENKKVILTKEDCLDAFDQFKKWEQEAQKIINDFNVPIFKIDYETLVEQPNETVFKIQKFLGVKIQKPLSLLVRQNTEPLKALIENYEELKKLFSATAFEHFFEE